MVNELQNELVRTCILGTSPDEAIKAMTQFVDGKFKNAKSQAGRLVMTEQAFFASTAQQQAFNELDVEEFEIVSTLDSKTSPSCQEMDGKHFAMKDFKAGLTAPSFHCWCRSCTCPYFDDEFSQGGMRAARCADGESYYVPDDMSYDEWKKTFVDGGDKNGLTGLGDSDIMDTISSPIERNSAKGNPNAILHFDESLSNSQQNLLNQLSNFDDSIIVSKKSVNMKDLSALTAKTGCEFAMFTKGSERLIVRGNENMVNITIDIASDLANQGYKWSGHTHPGTSINVLEASPGDRAILSMFNQDRAIIYDSAGKYRIFEV